MQTDDTIAAIASAVGAAARMIVRMSGDSAFDIASRITSDPLDSVRRCRLRMNDLEFCAWVYPFRSPRSYTGQDTIEFHLPGNPLLARMLLDNLVLHGARRADPGEFTARAYFNGRIDLSQAEGVAAIISANSESELRAARQLLAGELARRVKPAIDSVADTLALIEVGIDFSDEDVSFLSEAQIRTRLRSAQTLLDDLLRDSTRLERLHHMPEFVLVGRPNAGKSTLLNALAGEDRAVVSPLAGTTRDALSADVMLARGMIRLSDVAGISEAQPADDIERQMYERAMLTLQSADRVVLVQDVLDSQPLRLAHPPDLVVRSKADLLPPFPGTPGEGGGGGSLGHRADCPHPSPPPEYRGRGQEGIVVSAQVGTNMDALRKRLDQLAFGAATGETLAFNARHVQAIHEAREALARAIDHTCGPELLAVDLREALDSLGAIVGQITPDDVLGRIFSTFCIGK